MENFLFKLSVMLVPGMLAIVCHEVSHGFIAWRYGDPTARMLGRLTLNPFKHIDIIGTLMIFFIGIGWAKPVPVNFSNLRNPKRDMIWVAAAGPITNLILATVSAFLLRGLVAVDNSMVAQGSTLSMLVEPVALMLAFSVYINLLLAIFNMIPVPPLDGGRVLVGLLPYRQASAWARIEPFGMVIIIVLVFFTNIFSYVISPILNVGVHMLAGPQSGLVLGVTQLMMR
ncbi:site-2 protease family protein [Oryzomonas rubra]|uniref:Site-2 protease family protein n=1 Tax=Oryzomonas rubra TaxID=2509454 RepID=A0A5A9XRF4_9BACT|nr:site-2 protease family protein [Oryzomonas rubra]KAA0895125.1 site-2 protease family protein [Oryzomonas rubra]